MLTAVENKTPNVSNLVKKSDYNTKSSEIKNKITTSNYYLTSENFTARLKQENLASKNNIANFVKKTDFDNKLKNVTSNKNELNKPSKKSKQYQQKD